MYCNCTGDCRNGCCPRVPSGPYTPPLYVTRPYPSLSPPAPRPVVVVPGFDLEGFRKIVREELEKALKTKE